MPTADRLIDLPPFELEKAIADLLKAALSKRGACVTHDGKPGQPDIIVEADDFAFVVEVAKRSGADAASEYLAIRDHRVKTERELGKTTHLLFTCLSTPDRLIRAMVSENHQREAEVGAARSSFLRIESLTYVLDQLASSSADRFPLDRWRKWFHEWREIRDDVVAFDRAAGIVLAGCDEASLEVQRQVDVHAQLEQEALRRAVQHLEDVLRHRNILRDSAMHVLVYIVFVKLYEEKRETTEVTSRFTEVGFLNFRGRLPAQVRKKYDGRTLDYLLREIAQDEEVKEAGILEGVCLPAQIDDDFLIRHVLPVLDRYHFRGTHLDALGSVFEALARRAEKDTRIGQFFTPGPIVRMAIEIARPSPTELVLDPAAGTGRFLTASMERMLAQAREVPGRREADIAEAIKAERLLGTDADEWIVTIAKMNMYIHGDGKTNIRQENGLFLADLDSVFPGHADLLGRVDLVLTNPPLGDLNYQAYALDIADRSDKYADAAEWLKERLSLLPGRFVEERITEESEKKIAEWEERLSGALREGDESAKKAARKWKRYHEEKRAEAVAAVRDGRATYETSGSTAKGGALFLAVIKDYLRPVADESMVEEWRGGRVGIIVDEAILNTPEYAATRRFLRQHFFIKAVISIGRDAFWYQARTTAKTSLLYLVRKSDPSVGQREPIFYCHVEDIGFTRTGKPGESEIPGALTAYRRFEDAMSYQGHDLDEQKVRDEIKKMEWPASLRFRWLDEDGDHGERLDYAYVAAKEIKASLPLDHRTLGYYAEVVVRHPEEDYTRFYRFGTIDRNTGEVGFRELTDTLYAPSDLRVIREGDIVVSGIDLVNGAVGYADASVNGLVVSKEFYTLAVRKEAKEEVDPRFLAILLRTPSARRLTLPTGTSNRTRVEGEDALLALPLPDLPPLTEQAAVADQVHAAYESRKRAAETIDAALVDTDTQWQGEEGSADRPFTRGDFMSALDRATDPAEPSGTCQRQWDTLRD